MQRTKIFSALVVLLGSAACGPQLQPAPGELAKSDQQRITTAAPQADLDQAVAGNTDFALDVYRKVATGASNAVFSPHSVTVALSMTYGGAANATATAFETTLHQGLPAPRFHRAMNTLDLALSSRGQGALGKDGKPFRLNVNNQLFSQSGFTLETPFLDLLATEYGAGVRLLDFAASPEPSRQSINAWVDHNTSGLIPELLAQGSITSDTRLALVNTVYFNAAWKTPFKKDHTRSAAFHKLDGSTKQVQMMSGEDLTGKHAVRNGVDVVSLTYDGGEVELLMLAPPAGSFATFEAGLTSAELQAFVAAAQGPSVNLQMPKFDFKTQTELSQVLSALGLSVAFGPTADFTGMRKDGGLQITGVVHEAVVKTDEAGTEAAAATAVVVGVTSAPSFVTLDRPFVFAIRDVPTGSLIFLGRVVDP